MVVRVVNGVALTVRRLKSETLETCTWRKWDTFLIPPTLGKPVIDETSSRVGSGEM